MGNNKEIYLEGLSHELFAVAQLPPDEGIEDAVNRIKKLLIDEGIVCLEETTENEKTGNLKTPTYGQLMDAAKKHLKVSYTITEEVDGLELSENGVNEMVFAKNELGQASIIAEDGELRDGISNVIIRGWVDDETIEGGTKMRECPCTKCFKCSCGDKDCVNNEDGICDCDKTTPSLVGESRETCGKLNPGR